MKPLHSISFAVRHEGIITDVVVQDEYRFRPWAEQQQDNVVVVDLGANLGAFTLLAASYGCRVIAVEADPKLFGALTENLAANAWAKKLVDPLNIACTATARGQFRWMHSSGTLEGGVMHGGMGEPVSVPSRTLTEICDLAGVLVRGECAFLKCDIEGSETEVFADPKIPFFEAISMEWHNYDGLLFKALLTEAYGLDVQLEGCGDPRPPFDPTFARGLLHAR